MNVKSKKKFVIILTEITAVMTLAGTLLLSQAKNGSSFFAAGSGVSYGVSFSSTKNKFFSGTGTEDHDGEATIKTDLGNDISFTYATLAGGSSSVWHLVKPGGYFYNTTPIHGLEEISFVSTAQDKEFVLSWGYDTNYTLGSATLTSSTTSTISTFNASYPTYFKVVNIGDSNLSFKNINIGLSCNNNYPKLTVTSEDEEKGTASGGGTKIAGQNVTITASPKSGYRFVGWYDGESLVSDQKSYTFNMENADLSYVARFTYQSYNLVVNTESSQKGDVSDSSGSYDYLEEVTIQAFANDGYSFSGWYDGSSLISSDNPYTFNMPHANKTYTAKFSTNSYQLTLVNENSDLGSISGQGSYLYGNNVTINAYTNTGVSFLGWYDGETLVSANKSYSFTMPHNALTYTAKFAWTPYSVSLSVNDEDMGSVTGDGPYTYGQTVTLVATPNAHYSFFGWYNGETLLSQESTYAFSMPDNSLNYEARFVQNYNLIVYSDNESRGTVSAPEEFGVGLEVSVSSTGIGKYVLDYWADENYDEVSYDETYTFIMPDHDVELIGVFAEGHKVTLLVDSEDKCTLSGERYYLSGRDVTVTATANEGYVFDGWYLDSAYNQFVTSNNPYAFTMGSADLTLYARLITQEEADSLNYCEFALNSDEKSYTVSGHKSGSFGNLIIPSRYNGLPVTSIGYYAFYNCSSISSVVIPNSVTSIVERAFYQCRSLVSVDIPNSVETIGNSAFYECSSLTSISIPDSVTSIAESAFYGCSSLRSIVIGNNVTTINGYAFRGCSSLLSVTIGANVESIGSFVFFECYKLTEVINKSSLEITAGSSGNGYVGYYAAKVISDESEAGTFNIDENGFITYDDGDNVWLSGSFDTGMNVVVPNNVTKIKQNAFYGCYFISSVSIPNGVISIGNEAFYDCCKLVEVINKSSLSLTIGSSSNGYVANYAKQIISDEAYSRLSTNSYGNVIYTEDFENWLVNYVGNSEEVYITNNVKRVNQYAFYKCDSITSITGGYNVVSFGNYAFSKCTNLASIIIQKNVTSISIGSYAFYLCDSLTSISFSSNVKSIGEWAFSHCYSLTSVTFSTGLTTISNYAFHWCSKLESITFPNEITTIGASAFSTCYSLTSVSFGYNIATIGNNAFDGCTSLSSVSYISTKSRWNSVTKGTDWHKNVPATVVTCSNGTVAI